MIIVNVTKLIKFLEFPPAKKSTQIGIVSPTVY